MWVARHCFVGATYASFRTGGVKSPVDSFSIREPGGDGWCDNPGRNLHVDDHNGLARRPSILAVEAMSWVPNISQLQFSMTELNIFQEVADRTLSYSCADAGVTVFSRF